MKRLSTSLAVALIALGYLGAGMAYETPTHYLLSDRAFLSSDLSSSAFYDRLGLSHEINLAIFHATQGDVDNEFFQMDPSCDPATPMALRTLLVCGSMFEDSGFLLNSRSLNHFFDPAHGGTALYVAGKTWGMPSPSWALQGDNNVPPQQLFSYANARKYFYNALVSPGAATAAAGRYDQWGYLFQSLGQVIHHIQDMAQPQHTRNDPHLDTAFCLGLTNFLICHPSRFEQYTSKNPDGIRISQGALANVMQPVYPQLASSFVTPLDFWSKPFVGAGGGGIGMADYSNTNFVSQGTNFISDSAGLHGNAGFVQPQPLPVFQDLTPTQAFAPDPVPPAITQVCADVGQDNCTMTFFANQWTDPLSGALTTNLQASTESIFDEDLNGQTLQYTSEFGFTSITYTTTRIFALNRLNFNAAYPFLLPRAVSYSAGLLNYFFRGQMQIAAPAEGVYAIFDTSNCFKSNCASLPPNTVANAGFTKIKLLLKNTTPNDDMGSGILLAVAKYHLNRCYMPDLSGEYGGSAFNGDGCRTNDDYITVSNPISVNSQGTVSIGRNFGSDAIAFTFPQPIPMNASDLVLQVVFTGALGQEQGAVVVATKNISEPNFMAIQNFTDYVFDPGHGPNGGYVLNGDPDLDNDAAQPITLNNFTVAFGFNIATVGPTAIATLSSLGGGEHAQLALLMDVGEDGAEGVNGLSATWTHGNGAEDWIPDSTPFPRGVQEFTMDDTGPAAGHYTRTCPVILTRGVYRQSDSIFFNQVVDADDSSPTLKRAAVSSGQVLPKASVATDCAVAPIGIYDFSGMSALNPAAAKQWQINF